MQLNDERSFERSTPENTHFAAGMKTHFAQASGQTGVTGHIRDFKGFKKGSMDEGFHSYEPTAK